MAMVNSAIFLPKEQDLLCLGKLSGHARVQRERIEGEKMLHCVRIVDDAGTGVCIDSDYGDVEFKFECFFLNVFSCEPDSWGDAVEMCAIQDWDTIKCLFRFEYERPAAKGEVPESWVQVVSKAGKMREVSKEATAIGCALVGIMFWNGREQRPVLLVANEHIDCDDRTAIQVSKEQVVIDSFVSSCDSVNLEDAPKWSTDVRAWLAAQ